MAKHNKPLFKLDWEVTIPYEIKPVANANGMQPKIVDSSGKNVVMIVCKTCGVETSPSRKK
jgi:hypothetical protein